MSDAMTDYYAALERLKKRKGVRINNDAVAIEAGRTILVDQAQLVEFAERNDIVIVAVEPTSTNQLS